MIYYKKFDKQLWNLRKHLSQYVFHCSKGSQASGGVFRGIYMPLTDTQTIGNYDSSQKSITSGGVYFDNTTIFWGQIDMDS